MSDELKCMFGFHRYDWEETSQFGDYIYQLGICPTSGKVKQRKVGVAGHPVRPSPHPTSPQTGGDI